MEAKGVDLISRSEQSTRSVVSTRSFADGDEMSKLQSVCGYSQMGADSRLSQRLQDLSRKNHTKRTLSTQELEQQKVEQMRKDLHAQRRKNERTLRKALTTDIGGVLAAGRIAQPSKITVPKEFSLSAPPTPKGRRGSSAGIKAAAGRTLCRTPSAAEKTSPSRLATTPVNSAARDARWKPQFASPRGVASSETSRRGDTGRVATSRRKSVSCPPPGEDCGDATEEEIEARHLNEPTLARKDFCIFKNVSRTTAPSAAVQAGAPSTDTKTGNAVGVTPRSAAMAAAARDRAAAAARRGVVHPAGQKA
jgi:hypothetical protein